MIEVERFVVFTVHDEVLLVTEYVKWERDLMDGVMRTLEDDDVYLYSVITIHMEWMTCFSDFDWNDIVLCW